MIIKNEVFGKSKWFWIGEFSQLDLSNDGYQVLNKNDIWNWEAHTENEVFIYSDSAQ